MLYLNFYIIKKINNMRKDSSTLKINLADFPGGIVGKNPPANAGDRRWISSLGRFHMLQSNRACVPKFLSPWSRAQEPQLLKLEHLD